MKVLKNNFGKITPSHETVIAPRYPRKHICENCESELEYDKEDLEMGYLGCIHLRCPLCGHENMLVDHEDCILLTKDNVRFPTHYYHFEKKSDNKELINKYVKEAIEYLRNNKDDFSYFIGSGSVMVHAYRMDGDDEYNIFVAEDYYEVEVPFEPKDY